VLLLGGVTFTTLLLNQTEAPMGEVFVTLPFYALLLASFLSAGATGQWSFTPPREGCRMDGCGFGERWRHVHRTITAAREAAFFSMWVQISSQIASPASDRFASPR
jgi:hypothetical protein